MGDISPRANIKKGEGAIAMKAWYQEDYSFKIKVLAVSPDNTPDKHCRNGHEVGDEFSCEYACPGGLCAKSMVKLFPLLEAVRAGGDLRHLGGLDQYTIELCCPDGVVLFCLEARRKYIACNRASK